MNLKNLSDKFWLCFLTLFCFCSFPTALIAQESPFSKLKQKFEEGRIFNAEFHHQSFDSYTQDTVARKGHIWIGQNRYRIRTEYQSVVVNGQTSMVYDNNRNRVIISKYDASEDDFAPSRILNGIDSTFSVKTQEKRHQQIYIKLASDDPFAIYKKVEIYLSQTLIPQKIRAVDSVDNIITTTFNNGSFGPSTRAMFMLDYPNGAEIVDMRN